MRNTEKARDYDEFAAIDQRYGRCQGPTIEDERDQKDDPGKKESLPR